MRPFRNIANEGKAVRVPRFLTLDMPRCKALSSWVNKYRTESGSDRFEHSMELGLATLLTLAGVLG